LRAHTDKGSQQQGNSDSNYVINRAKDVTIETGGDYKRLYIPPLQWNRLVLEAQQ
jgi:hypothetical protein